ncbi:MAG TPA: methyltransferase domain-containing protein [Blastocatellia bacterium]|nr:methyltransferase domain-containing protein [Blastocatellia bacterium]
METYDEQFYQALKTDSLNSAREIVPFIVKFFQPRSVIDLGCGVGAWLSVFRELGVSEILGIDGDYVSQAMLCIPSECFFPFDLTQPLRPERQFDLAMSVEVAEHLPAECAESFVNTLTGLAPVILFSAAVPNQGGTNHINEQWPEYWARLFRKRGFLAADCLRMRFWNNERVTYYYAQNLFLYARRDYLDAHPGLASELQFSDAPLVPLVHPQLLRYRMYDIEREEYWRAWYQANPDPRKLTLLQVLSVLPELSANAAKRRFKRLSAKLTGARVITGIQTERMRH